MVFASSNAMLWRIFTRNVVAVPFVSQWLLVFEKLLSKVSSASLFCRIGWFIVASITSFRWPFWNLLLGSFGRQFCSLSWVTACVPLVWLLLIFCRVGTIFRFHFICFQIFIVWCPKTISSANYSSFSVQKMHSWALCLNKYLLKMCSVVDLACTISF